MHSTCLFCLQSNLSTSNLHGRVITLFLHPQRDTLFVLYDLWGRFPIILRRKQSRLFYCKNGIHHSHTISKSENECIFKLRPKKIIQNRNHQTHRHRPNNCTEWQFAEESGSALECRYRRKVRGEGVFKYLGFTERAKIFSNCNLAAIRLRASEGSRPPTFRPLANCIIRRRRLRHVWVRRQPRKLRTDWIRSGWRNGCRWKWWNGCWKWRQG